MLHIKMINTQAITPLLELFIPCSLGGLILQKL